MSVEFFNLVFAFATTALGYPAPFWRANHAFTFIFSLLLTLLGVQSLLEVNSAEIIVKLCWNNKALGASLAGLCQPVKEASTPLPADNVDLLDPSVFEKPANDNEGLQNASSLFLSITGTLMMLCLMVTVFDYGLEQLVKRPAAVANMRKSVVYTPTPQDVAASDATSMQAGGSGVVSGLKADVSSGQTVVVWRRIVAVLGTFAVLANKMPILLAAGRVFGESMGSQQQPLLLAYMVATVTFFCVWFIVWFAFCLKPEWKVNVSSHLVY